MSLSESGMFPSLHERIKNIPCRQYTLLLNVASLEAQTVVVIEVSMF